MGKKTAYFGAFYAVFIDIANKLFVFFLFQRLIVFHMAWFEDVKKTSLLDYWTPMEVLCMSYKYFKHWEGSHV